MRGERDQRPCQGAAQARGYWRTLRVRKRFAERLELAELNWTLVAGVCDGAADEAQCHFGGQTGEFLGIELDRAAIAPSPVRDDSRRCLDGHFDRRLGTTQAPR